MAAACRRRGPHDGSGEAHPGWPGRPPAAGRGWSVPTSVYWALSRYTALRFSGAAMPLGTPAKKTSMPSEFIRVSASAITAEMGTLTTTSSAPRLSVMPMTKCGGTAPWPGVEGEQLAVVALRQVGQTVLEALQALIAHFVATIVRGPSGCWMARWTCISPMGPPAPTKTVVPLDAGHSGCAPLRRRRRCPAPATEVGGVVVVQTAHVGVHQAVQGGLAHHVEGAPPGYAPRHGTHRRAERGSSMTMSSKPAPSVSSSTNAW